MSTSATLTNGIEYAVMSTSDTLTLGIYYSEDDLSITSITPNYGTTEGGTPVTVVGTGFNPVYATAAIDGNDLTDLVIVDETTITGVTPAGTAGVVDVTVTNP